LQKELFKIPQLQDEEERLRTKKPKADLLYLNPNQLKNLHDLIKARLSHEERSCLLQYEFQNFLIETATLIGMV